VFFAGELVGCSTGANKIRPETNLHSRLDVCSCCLHHPTH
jgi:hypothetical protein